MNYFGQQIIDKTEEVFQSAYYDSNWYIMTPEIRRYILLIQNNSTKRKNLTAGKMGEVSLEAAGIVSYRIIYLLRLIDNFVEESTFMFMNIMIKRFYNKKINLKQNTMLIIPFFVAATEVFSFLFVDPENIS